MSPPLAMRLLVTAALVLTLAACGKADNEPGPGGVTMGEARALDEAAELIERQRLPAEPAPSASSAPPGPTAS